MQDLQKEGDVLQENLSTAHESVLAWAQSTVAAIQKEKEAVTSFVARQGQHIKINFVLFAPVNLPMSVRGPMPVILAR